MFHVFASIFIISCVTTIQAAPRIVGGLDAPDGKYPYLVSIQFEDYHLCGGSIINQRWILTAAHCVLDAEDPKYVTVIAGTSNINSTNGQYYKIDYMVSHKDFHFELIQPDIGLMHLTEDVKFTTTVQPIKLSKENFTKINHPTLLAGWGYKKINDTPTNDLQEITLRSISLEDCKAAWTKLVPESESVGNYHLCTLNKVGEGACNGDSGGPLVANGEQIGIVSFSEPCAVGIPDVFLNVYCFLDWISNEIEKYEHTKKV